MPLSGQQASCNLCKFRRQLFQGMGLEAAHQGAVGLAGLAVNQSAVKELDNLASSSLHAACRSARLTHRPAALDHVIEIKSGKVHSVDVDYACALHRT
jgi:hypothetical protein